ncbi:PAS domain S-box protein [Marinobacterium rhizophilum]|uniref:histidine kinase n=1 Tax=Marinobacterium rhizophilum TaxID=420402 RepID=A0ABY5HJW3_9GAMM|nr:PAS domain S-box protein [Marinobacterium rhizophilum]UTW12239.1 PAS domain S-box protein [Marinobacterium rhizophilum]
MNQPARDDTEAGTRWSPIWIVLLSVLLLGGFVSALFGGWGTGSVATHTLLEVVATVLALVTGGIALVRFYSRPEIGFLVLGAGLVGAGLLDASHSLLSAAGFESETPSSLERLAPWSWFASRFYLSVLLFTWWRLRKASRDLDLDSKQLATPVFIMTGVVVTGCFLFFAWVPLPLAHYSLAVVSRPEELIPGAFFLLALWGLWRDRRWTHDRFEYWLVVTLVLSCLSQLLIMPFSASLFDVPFVSAHLVKIGSYLALLAGLFCSMYQTFRQKEQETSRRRQAETQLGVTESRLQLLFDLSPVGIAMTETGSQRFVDANDALLVATGYSREAFLELDYQAVATRSSLQVNQDLEGGNGRYGPIESEFRRKDGSRFPVLLSGVKLTDETGREVVWSIVQDISTRKAAEQALVKDREFLKTVLDNLTDGVVACDESGTLTLFNNAAFEFHGLSPERLDSEHWGRHYSLYAEDGQTVLAPEDIPLLRAQSGDIVRNVEVVIAPAGLPRRTVLCSGQPILTPEGQQLGAVVVMHDISERKQAQWQVEQLNARLKLATQAAKVGIWDYAFDSKTLVWDANMHDLYGYADGEFDGRYRSWINQVHPEDRQRVQQTLDGLLLKDQPVECELRIILPAGEIRWLKAFAILSRDPSGRPLRMTGTNWDITETKHSEQMKNEFISTVSHELRTPLTSISGSLGLLAGGALGELPDKARPLLEIAQKNSQRLIHLINDLLDIEKITAGKMTFNYQTLDLSFQLQRACEDNQGYAETHGVELKTTKSCRESWLIRADEQRLQQILANFLSNAIKFSPAGGLVELGVQKAGERVRIEVTDQGRGIPESFHGRIFQKFAQADGSDTKATEGTGLGLSICKELADCMGGSVGFDSIEGQGSCFYVEFEDLKVESSEPEPDVSLPEGVSRVLVVEDEPDIARLISLMLKRGGVANDVVFNGKQALEQLRAVNYDAMTLDLLLPDIAGSKIIRSVREWEQDEGRLPLPILVVSVMAEEGRLEIGGNFPVVDWMSKPIDEARLLASIRHMLPKALPSSVPRILHVEDDEDLCEVVNAMANELAVLDRAGTLASARRKLAHESYDLVILDLGLPDGSGWSLLPELKELALRPQIMLLSATEVSYTEAQQVDAVLLKSRVSHQNLMEQLGTLLEQTRVRRLDVAATAREVKVPVDSGAS